MAGQHGSSVCECNLRTSTALENAILPEDLTEASGDLTPKLSVKRKVVIDKYRSVIEELYRS
jgi:long-chain acyl-CoA synthetase